MMHRRRHFQYFITILLLWITASMPVSSTPTEDGEGCQQRYVFSWNHADTCHLAPRGGTSTGAPVSLDEEVSPQWLELQEEGLSDFERDRRAILAMAGPYRASFEFIETVGFAPRFEPAAPYKSWGTEYVYVVEDSGDFISLQHVMVMFSRRGDEISGPHVMKHWRQDWQYEKQTLLAYAGNGTWEKQTLDPGQAAGTWAQAVFQVDDSPRYESHGAWEHSDSFSSWRSALTWRPLPRRESTVRDDYTVLEGYNRHTILPTGWVQEEENLKLQLTSEGRKKGYLARELGNNRYERITGFDFSAGDRYWEETGPFWQIVRQGWADIIAGHDRIAVKEIHDGTHLFAALFGLAEDFQGGKLNEAQATEKVMVTLNRYFSAAESP